MTFSFLAVGCGLPLLFWGADRFVDGAAQTARHFGMPPLLVGMVVVGFGTSAPEMVVSLFAMGTGIKGRPGRINRFEGALLLLGYAAYTIYLVSRVYLPMQG